MTQRKVKIKPCPWCGKIPAIKQLGVILVEGFLIECETSSCAEPYFIRDTRHAAINAWNRRGK